jgi:hypothetical protein
LGEPLVDTVLKPGEVLYVPAGFPHTTDTENTASAGAAADDDSVHLTIGIDTHIWGLNYASARSGALCRAKAVDSLTATTLEAQTYWEVMGIPPCLGFLKQHAADADTADRTLVHVTRLTEPSRWEGQTDEELSSLLAVSEVNAQLRRHTQQVVDVQRAMYLDAARDHRPCAPGAPRVSLFRVKSHMDRLEMAMEDHLQWYGPEAAARAAAAAKPDTGVAKAKGRKATGVGSKASGFGGAGSGATKKKGKKKRR